jgi:hypothetical protein
MALDFTIMLPNRPGVLANLCNKLGKAGINIEGISGTQYQDKVVLHLMFEEKSSEAQALLYKNNFTITSTREVLTATVKNQPGELGKISQQLANAEINIDFIYLGKNNQVVIGVDDIEKARDALEA